MTVRDRVGRVRYVAFRVVGGAPLERHEVARALPEAAKLTRFDGEYGIVRARHVDRDAVVAALAAARPARGARFETLVTSGTIKGAARALPAESAAAKRGRKPR